MIKIYTLGDFDINIQDKPILDSANYSYRLIKLFKYFLTFRNRKLVPEKIIGDLWHEEDFIDPKRTLRTQISRLRRGIGNGSEKDTFFNISFSYGYYIFTLDEKCVLDADIFQKCIEKGNKLRDEYPEKAIEAYKEAVSIYRGEYLSESEYEEWLIPVRNRYERLYLQSVFRLLELLGKSKRYSEIVEICEEGMYLVPYSEALNICFMEALLNIGEKKYALSHYKYITSKWYRDLGEMPSDEMKKTYKKLINNDKGNENIEIFHIDEKLSTRLEKEGALLCEPDHFTFLYNLEKRRSMRKTSKGSFIGIITASTSKNIQPAGSLESAVSLVLRKGDVFSIWNENQVVFILSDIEYKNISLVEGRIIKKFNSIKEDSSLQLKISIKPISNK